jgi:hypothetical protein
MVKTNPATPVHVIEETPVYWRVVVDYPPFNIGTSGYSSLQDLLARTDSGQGLRVIVESANPDFYLAQFDLTRQTGNLPYTRPFQPPNPDRYLRPSQKISCGQRLMKPHLIEARSLIQASDRQAP